MFPHVARHVINWAIKNHGKSAVQKAIKNMEIKLQEKPYQKSSFLVRKSLMNNGKSIKKNFQVLLKKVI